MRVLIIDNNAQVSSFIKKGLSVEGHHISIALDGSGGLAMSLSNQYDIIILDLVLPPTIDGLEVCRQTRQHGLQTPILILSTIDNVDIKIKSFEAGADDFLAKPFVFEELLARINALQRRSGYKLQGGSQQLQFKTVLRVADLSLDHQTHRVCKSGKAVDLTHTEFVLLEYLMQHIDCVVSRTMIEDRVWGYQKDPLTNIVDVYIRRLRKKLNAHRLIKTVRGVGYQILDPDRLTT